MQRKMITLYQLHWSHYVEKVRWALDFKGVEWRAVDVDPFTKREMQHLNRKTTLDSGRQLYTVPTIHDGATGEVVGESSQILDYLERTYPTPSLYPADPAQRQEVMQLMLWLDSTLGLGARRLAYTQVALENPGVLGQLFVPQIVGTSSRWNVKAKLAGAIIAGVLTRRFRFLHNRADRVFEQLEQCLLIAARRLSTRRFLVGDGFSAADLTLASLLRPLSVVPFFREHPGLRGLFDWREALLEAHGRQTQLIYETSLQEVRKRRGWAYGAASWIKATTRSDAVTGTDIPTLAAARNDQHSVGRWPVLTGPFWFARLKLTSGLKRTPYVA
jgi:glutathione S-transferase